MKVIVIKKGTLEAVQYNAVSNIAYAAGTVTITYGGGTTATYTAADYMLQFIL